jgi:geranylgeranyl pyrophosphate synthase
MSLSKYLAAVALRVDDAVRKAPFADSQRALLQRATRQILAPLCRSPYDNPLALMVLVARAHGRSLDEQAEHVGAFLVLYMCSADLVDDIEDGDLSGKAHEQAGTAIAVNDAFTLLVLALRSLRTAAELEPVQERRLAYFEAFERAGLVALAGQHGDLTSEGDEVSPAEVLRMHQAKTSSVSLVFECGALLAGVNDELRARYRQIGEHLGEMLQVIDDLGDIFGKSESPDLAARKATYPYACFLEVATATQIEEFRALRARLPGSLREIRRLLYDSGAVERSARALERLRRSVHAEVLGTQNYGSQQRMLLAIVDRLAQKVYEPEPIAETRDRFAPRGVFHDAVRDELAAFLQRMGPFEPPPAPSPEPWHLPQYMYEATRSVVYYPDLDDLADEVAPFQAELLGTSEEEAVSLLREQLQAVLAHEMFHYWRDRAGRLTNDKWHEEYAANRLALGYVRRFCPEALERALALADRILPRFEAFRDATVQELLDDFVTPRPGGREYGMDPQKAAIVQLEMLRRLVRTKTDLDADVAMFLGSRSVLRRSE